MRLERKKQYYKSKTNRKKRTKNTTTCSICQEAIRNEKQTDGGSKLSNPHTVEMEKYSKWQMAKWLLVQRG